MRQRFAGGRPPLNTRPGPIGEGFSADGFSLPVDFCAARIPFRSEATPVLIATISLAFRSAS
jgi:hypothetical protein